MRVPRRPIPFALHRLDRSDPRRRAAEVERDEAGFLPVVPARGPRLRAGKPGRRGLTPYQRQQQERGRSAARRSWRERLRGTLAALLAATQQKRERRDADLRDEECGL